MASNLDTIIQNLDRLIPLPNTNIAKKFSEYIAPHAIDPYMHSLDPAIEQFLNNYTPPTSRVAHPEEELDKMAHAFYQEIGYAVNPDRAWGEMQNMLKSNGLAKEIGTIKRLVSDRNGPRVDDIAEIFQTAYARNMYNAEIDSTIRKMKVDPNWLEFFSGLTDIMKDMDPDLRNYPIPIVIEHAADIIRSISTARETQAELGRYFDEYTP